MLVWVLRSDFGLTGTKWGCEIGACGACTVLVNDKAVLACQTPVKDVQGKHVVTIEGLARNGELHPLQKAFIEHDALQCGYCTPGMILTAYSLLTENVDASDDEIIRGMDENLCRCGAHTRILDAIRTAAREMKGARR
jgi:aerobic-type carbon monoxide dehydrogenase small subunit (CoxS/CutS family)